MRLVLALLFLIALLVMGYIAFIPKKWHVKIFSIILLVVFEIAMIGFTFELVGFIKKGIISVYIFVYSVGFFLAPGAVFLAVVSLVLWLKKSPDLKQLKTAFVVFLIALTYGSGLWMASLYLINR